MINLVKQAWNELIGFLKAGNWVAVLVILSVAFFVITRNDSRQDKEKDDKAIADCQAALASNDRMWQAREDALKASHEAFKDTLMKEYKKKAEESDEAIRRFMTKESETKVYVQRVREGQGKNIKAAKRIEEKVQSISKQEE